MFHPITETTGTSTEATVAPVQTTPTARPGSAYTYVGTEVVTGRGYTITTRWSDAPAVTGGQNGIPPQALLDTCENDEWGSLVDDSVDAFIPLQATITFQGALTTDVGFNAGVGNGIAAINSFGSLADTASVIIYLTDSGWDCSTLPAYNLNPGQSVTVLAMAVVFQVISNASPTLTAAQTTHWSLDDYVITSEDPFTITASGPGDLSCAKNPTMTFSMFLYPTASSCTGASSS